MPTLVTECPVCRGVRPQKVTRTHDSVRELPDQIRRVAREKTGTTPRYRLRERECERCKVTFKTVEISIEVFDAIEKRLIENKKQECRLGSVVDTARKKLDAASDVIKGVHETLKSADSELTFYRKVQAKVAESRAKSAALKNNKKKK